MGITRSLVDRLTHLMGWIRRNQRIGAPHSNCVKVNLGCGLTVAPGWINIDGSLSALVAGMPAWFHPIAYRVSGAHKYYSQSNYCDKLRKNKFVHHDLLYGIPLPDKSVDYVYSSHFFEHLDRVNAKHLLTDCLQVLKPNGVIRIGVPDLEHAWVMYKRGEKERMLHNYFFIDGATGYSRHQYLYDFEMLANVLQVIGFIDVYRAKFQEGWTPDLTILDNRMDYTLFVEARRPNA